MSRELPFVDVHRVPSTASRDALWDSVVRALATDLGRHVLFARLLGCDPARPSAHFSGEVGQTVAGFRVVASERGRLLQLAGRHRFSVYRLTFVVEDGALAAETHAAFPGIHGAAYRAAVIGSGAHAMLTTRMVRAMVRGAQPSA